MVGLSAHGGRRGVHCGLAAAAHAGHLKLRIAALTCFVLAPGKAHETWSMTTRWSDESASDNYSNFQGIYRGVAVSAAERARATSG